MMALQITWFILILVLLTGYIILDGFDLGVGIWHLFTKKREVSIRSIEPFWDGNEVWLLTGGGAIFAAFPPVYASSFSAFYLALMLLLVGLIFRAVSIEFRKNSITEKGKNFWDICFSVGSIVPALLFGVALGNIIRGLPLNANGDYTGTFFGLLNPYALLIGVLGLVMFALHGQLYLAMKTSIKKIEEKSIMINWITYVILATITVITTLTLFKGICLHGSIAFGVLAILANAVIGHLIYRKKTVGAFIASSLTMVANMAFVAMMNAPMMIPQLTDRSQGLSIYNSSSSQTTLTVMLVLAGIGMPIVIGYTIFLYRVFRGKVD